MLPVDAGWTAHNVDRATRQCKLDGEGSWSVFDAHVESGRLRRLSIGRNVRHTARLDRGGVWREVHSALAAESDANHSLSPLIAAVKV